MDAQELQDPGKVSVIWIKNVNSISMKLKDEIKLDIMDLNKSKTCPEEKELPGNDYTYIYISLVNNMKMKRMSY